MSDSLGESRYNFIELDALTRELMMAELDIDITQKGSPNLGKELSQHGKDQYVGLLRSAIDSGNESTLAAELALDGRMDPTSANSNLRLAKTEFNRFYIRAICERARIHGTNDVKVYRAHGAHNPRSSSVALDRTIQPAPRILANLRGPSLDPETGIGKVNSGMTIRCGCDACGSRS